MLVQRIIWRAKRGSVRKLRQALAAEVEAMNAPHSNRILIPSYGGSGEVTITETEFEDIAERDRFSAEWGRTRADAFFAKIDPLTESMCEEIFRVLE